MKAVGAIKMDSVEQTSTVSDKHWGNSNDPNIANASLDSNEHNQTSCELSYLVLVVDDDPMIRLLAQQALNSRSFMVVQAENAKDALQIFETKIPDLILCDVMMPPGMDGFELCRRIKADDK